MGMSIEDIIQGLKETNMICNSVFAYDRKKYIDGAIDKLCKYQRIQEIVYGDWDKGYQYSETIVRIKRVLAEENKEHF